MKKTFLIIYICFFTLFLLFSKDLTGDWKEISIKFRNENIAKDIAYADFSQLKSMAKKLGLKEEDNANAYRNALYKYYGINNPYQIEREKTGEKIILEKAGELKMQKFKDDDEELLHILGRAKIILNSKDKDNQSISRTIEADEILIDLKNKEISGMGNVIFKDKDLEFYGNQFYFNFKVNRGVLFEGTTKLLKGGESGLQGAFFKGERIVQTDTDDAILQDGELTTCDEDDPHFSIKVSRIWINQKGEWGLLNPVVSIGPIPFFYFPIYYHPKNLKINPVLGFRNREGWFFNSTYYILGEQGEVKKDSSDVFGIAQNRADPLGEKSVFRLTNAMLSEKLDKFYNKYEFYKKYPQFRIKPQFQSIDFALRVFGDAYVNLGFFFGAYYYMKMEDSRFPFKLALLSDYAFSRLVWKDTNETDLYVPYNPSHKLSANYNLGKNNTYLYPEANPLTFRSSQWLVFSGAIVSNIVNLSYELQVEYASDTDYYRDFYNRTMYFSYIDLMFNAIQYGILSKKDSGKAFTLQEEKVASSKDEINNYIKISFSPKTTPDIYGLKPMSSISLDLTSNISQRRTTIQKYAPSTDNGNVDDPKYERYMLYSFSVPELNYRMSGTLANFKIIQDMPKKYLETKNINKQKEIDNTKLNELYFYINKIRSLDATKDSSEINYNHLLPLFLKKNESRKEEKNDYDIYGNIRTFMDTTTDYYYLDKKVEEKKEDDQKIKDYQKLYNIQQASISLKDSNINIIDFDLNYNFSDTLTNKFFFKSDGTDDYPELDTTQKLFSNRLDINKITDSFNLNNYLTYTMKGRIDFITFSNDNSKIFTMSPSFYLSYKKNWDNMDIYRSSLERTNLTSTSIEDLIRKKEKTNRELSELLINYEDTIRNDLSFGNKIFQGTGISTYIKLKIFKFNEQKQYNFQKLNELNASNSKYVPIDTFLYDNMDPYSKIESLYTNITLKFNFFPEGGPHTMDISAGPKINWLIPKSNLDIYKQDIWNDSSSDVIWTADYLTEAKEYIYFKDNCAKLNEKVSLFYKQENFWDGEKNFRKMFENISINYNYSYKYSNNITIVSLSSSFVFKLENVGRFSTGNGKSYPENLSNLSFYPDFNLNLGFINSLITYSMSLNFTKELDTKYPDYTKLTDKQKNLDEYKIIVLNYRHTFNFSLPGNLFEFKLPSGNWVTISSSTNFRWNKNVTWSDNSEENYLFLESQTISTKILMDIFQINLNFRYFNFKNIGYGFELDSGSVRIGYRIKEIPVFLKYFRVEIDPSITYDFNVKHTQFYEGSTLKEFNEAYYSNNRLNFYLGLDLYIGEKTDFETKIHFHFRSMNKKMYKYYSEEGLESMFTDFFNSFNFADNNKRKSSNFNVQEVVVSIDHNLHDWNLKFEYIGKPEKATNINRYYWENTFTFLVTWKIGSDNQLLKMFNKTKINERYEKGEWKQRDLSLDPSKD
ncbi:MAG TPA: hypothetical protein PLD75_09555 [Spirochaetota bacterium]|nr:hypothetical protein [Spirochaetota bacterium]